MPTTFTTTSAASPDVTGDYGSKTGIQRLYGTTNANTYSNREGGTTANDTVYADFLAQADAMISNAWTDAGETTTPIDSSDSRYDRLVYIANRWAGAMMYLSRGMYDASAGEGNLQGLMSGHAKEAEKELSAIIRLWRRAGSAPSAGVSNAARRMRPYVYLPAIPSTLPDGLD